MKSIEVFATNVREQLSRKRMRIKDLAQLVGVSDSYLSLVFSGARDNLNDIYKDRIAAALGTTVAALYSDTQPTEPLDYDVFLALQLGSDQLGRRRDLQTLEDWMQLTALPDDKCTSVYREFSRLGDETASQVAHFLAAVMRGWHDHQGASATSEDTSVTQQWGRLAELTCSALLAAAVLGEGCPLDGVAALLDVESSELLSAYGQTPDWCQLHPGPEGLTVAFTSPAVRRSIYRRSSPVQRQQLHGQAAQWLLQRNEVHWQHKSELARHHLEAGDMGAALQCAQEAGDAAFSQHFYHPALTLYGQALALARAQGIAEILPDLSYKQSLTYAQLGRWNNAIEQADQARLQFAANADVRSEIICLSLLGSLYAAAGQLREAGAVLDQALALSEGNQDEQSKCRILHNAAVVQLQQGLWDEAEGQLLEALRSAERQSQLQSVAEILVTLGWLKLEQQQVETALTRLHRALALARDTGNERLMARAHYYLGHSWAALQEQERSHKAFVESVHLADRTHDLRCAARARLEVAANSASELQLPQRIREIRETMEQLASLHDQIGLVRAGGLLSDLLLEAEQVERSVIAIRKAVELAEQNGDWRSLVLALQGYVQHYVKRQDEAMVTIFSRRLQQLLRDDGRVYPGV